MKKIILILIPLLFNSSVYFSQSDSLKGPFIKLRSGELIHGQKIELKEHSDKSGNIYLDEKKYATKQVEFIMDSNNHLYAGYGSLTASYFDKDGIYFYKQRRETIDGKEIREYDFFSNGLSKIQKINATNFKDLMKNDIVANNLIQKANKAKKACTISLFIAGGLFISSFVINGNSDVYLGVSGAGGAALISAAIANGIKKNKTRKAIKKYYGIEIDGYN
jgi:hypothetical protein